MEAQDMFKYSILRNFQTDNVFLNTIITCVVVSFSSILFSHLRNFKNYFEKLLKFLKIKKDRTAELEFSCDEIHSYYGTTMKGSKTFKALLWTIREKIKSEQIFGLKYIKEFRENEDNYRDEEDEEDDEIKDDILYIMNQDDEFYIEDDIFEDINFQFETIETDSKEEGRNTKSKINHCISVFSRTKSIKYLQHYIETVKKNYLKYLNDLVNKKQHVFELEGESDSGDLEYSIYPFSTTCSINKIYFDDKEEILNQVYFFRDNKSWYQKHGKPYTLGICSYGEPGCGKTSFEKCLTKMLNRHMIKVDLSKIKTKRMANKLFFSEKLGEYNIPYDKRVYVFYEVDRMSDILFNEEHKKKSKESKKTSNSAQPVIINNSKNNDEKVKLDDKDSFNIHHVLDILDGIPERTGQIIMMSTNNFQKLDKALLRPGRIDCPIHFKKCNQENTIKLVEDYFENKIPEDKSKEIKDRNFTPAEIFQLCSKYNDIEKVITDLI